jgi:putative ABC transport system permease protein
MAFWRRLLLLLPWRRRAAERDMEDELREIAAMAEPRELGNLSLVAEDARAAWGWPSVERLRVDVRHALLGFRSYRGTTTLAFAILTLTLAAGTVTFSVVDAVALRPLPFASPDRLVAIAHLPRPDGDMEPASPQDFFAWREGTRSFDGIAGAVYGGTGTVRLETDRGAEDVVAVRATANLFDVLGMRPALGRLFQPGEDSDGRDSVLVLSHETWTRLFNADPDVVGRRVTLAIRQASVPYEVIGVLPPDVTYPVTSARPADVYRPYVATATERDYAARGRSFFLNVVGRLRPGVTIDQAGADVERATAAARATHGMNGIAGARMVVLSLHDRVVGRAKSWLLLVLAAVVCVAMVGCVNVAALLLARSTVRMRELATRAALGASRARLARTLFAEGLLVAGVSSAAAVLLAYWGVDLAKASLPGGLARASSIAVDVRVMTVSACAAILCGLVTGGVPAWRVSRADLFSQIRVGGGVIGGRRQGRSLGGFLIAEVAFVTVLLVATTLVVTSFVAVTTVDLGFERRNVIALGLQKSLRDVPREQQKAARTALFDDAIARARAVPGVTHVGLIDSSEPLAGGGTRYSLVIPGMGELTGADMFEKRAISPEYFPAMGLRLLRGRAFTEADGAGAPAVAIINDLAAKRYFQGREPIGQIIEFREAQTEIVGIVQNVRLNGPEADLRTELYVPLAQEPPLFMALGTLIVRTVAAPTTTAAAVREAIRPVLPDVGEPRLVNDAFRRLTADRRFNAGLMTLFGLIAVAIGAIGIYGTMAFLVAQQTKAIGLRMALGASQANVLRAVLWSSLWRVGLGAVLGLAGARAVSSLFTALVFGVESTSPAVYAFVAGGLVAMAILAALVPARRAARIDPLTALRAE